MLLQNIANGQSFELLRVHDKGPERRALFRLTVAGDGGINYFDFILNNKSGTEEVEATDLFILLSGEKLSRSFRRVMVPIAAQMNRSFLQKLSGWENDFVKHANDIQQIGASMQRQNFQVVLATYKKLPKSLREDKNFLLVRLAAAQNIDDEEYLQCIKDYQRLFPDDPAIDFISVDGFVLKGEHKKAIECLERFEKTIGGDIAIRLMIANLMGLDGQYEKAEAIAMNALKERADFEDAYWTLISISLEQSDFKKTVVWLEKLESDFDIEFFAFHNIPEYAKFVASPEYTAWEAKRKG
jgi:tetratricopeptide (TPR) repeat protein